MANSGVYEEDFDDISEHASLYADSLGADTISPADGYFSERDHPQETFVEESSVQAESEQKAREAAESQASASSPPSRAAHETLAQPPVWAHEGAPLLDAGPAPPDYAAATADRQQPEANDLEVEQEADAQRHGSDGVADYGSIAHGHEHRRGHGRGHGRRGGRPPGRYPGRGRGRDARRSHSEASTTSHESEVQHNLPWPFGQQGNPFGPDFPFGPGNNPFTRGFPFGPGGNPFQANGQPQSMRDADDGVHHDEETATLLPQHSARPRRRWIRTFCKPMHIVNILLVILVVGLILLLARATREVSRGGSHSDDDHEHPDSPHEGGHGKDPESEPYRPNATLPTNPRSSKCEFSQWSDSQVFGFGAVDNFTVMELMGSAERMNGGVSGTIWIEQAPPEQAVDVLIWISYAATDPSSLSAVTYGYSSEGLQLHFKDKEPNAKPPVAYWCMDVSLRVYVRRDATINNLNILTESLDVVVEDGLFGGGDYDMSSSGLWITNSTTIIANGGNVTMVYWSSRETRVETRSGSIKGAYGLRDVLSLHSDSGSINVNVDPREADPSKPAPAKFAATTHSGNIYANFPTTGYIPDRDYQMQVESHSSSISGTYILGTAAYFRSSSGSINVDVLPYHATTSGRELASENHSGSTALTLLPPYHEPTYPINKMRSSHTTSSGQMRIAYPQEWIGDIEGHIRTGAFYIEGKDVHVYLDGHMGMTGQHIIARKGYGSSRLDFKSNSASVRLRVGDV